MARERGIDLNRPWKSLPEAQRRVILYGTGDERVRIKLKSSRGSGAFTMRYTSRFLAPLLPRAAVRRMTPPRIEGAVPRPLEMA